MTRNPLDAYYTPSWMTKGLTGRLPIIGTVLEPCAGDGGIADVILDTSLAEDIFCNDIDPAQDWCDFHMDAAMPEFWEQMRESGGFDWVITNPPYDPKLLPEIIKGALETAEVGVAMLLRLSFLEPTEERTLWLPRNEPDCAIVTPRHSFTNNGKTDSVTTAWFIWYNLVGAPTIWPRGIKVMERSEKLT